MMVGLQGCWQVADRQRRQDAVSRTLLLPSRSTGRVRTFLLAAALASLSACIPITVSTRCRETANSCLDGCPPDRGPTFDDRSLGASFTNDSRNACEKRCHDVASSCESDEPKK